MAYLKTRAVSGERRYDVCWREHGKTRSRTFVRQADAETFRLDVARKKQLGTLYQAPPVTLAEAKADFWTRWEIGVSDATAKRNAEAWPHFQSLEHVPLVALTPAVLEDTTAAAARVAPRQAQLGLAMAKRIIRDAQNRGQRVDPAVLDVRAPRYEEREPVFLTYAELIALAKPMPPEKLEQQREMTLEEFRGWMPDAVRRFPVFAGLSGLRLGELLGLVDTDVDLSEGCLLVQRSFKGQTKSRKRRRVYLCQYALHLYREQLLAREPNTRGLVFPSPAGHIWNPNNFRARVFRPAVKRLAAETQGARADEIARLTIHDLRHTFASLMVASNANPLQIAELLGHTDSKGQPDATLVWRRYGHLYPGSGKQAATALGQHLAELAA